ncbi:MAG TPA: M15 family metallopeptidase [Candidatus Anaerofilum excrementigallinarum]|nr:M15 family metallopeptidase [Candidatus Anaerofilum excrementigallinarum]
MQNRDPGRGMGPAELRLRQKMRKKRRQRRRRRLMLLAVAAVALIALLLFLIFKGIGAGDKDESSSAQQSSSAVQSQSQPAQSAGSDSQQTQSGSEPASAPASDSGSGIEVVGSRDDWRLILANKNSPLPEGYAPELVTLADSSLQMQTEAAAAFDEMRQAANATGLHLMACSTYRSVERQTELYDAEVQKWIGKGYAEADAREKAATVVMIPGCSEHNTGLAVDVGSVTNQRVEEDFEDEPEFDWLQEHAAEYGFILRYPSDKQAITGVSYEPWHYRYVGVENAKAIKESGLCLEEYLGLLQ